MGKSSRVHISSLAKLWKAAVITASEAARGPANVRGKRFQVEEHDRTSMALRGSRGETLWKMKAF